MPIDRTARQFDPRQRIVGAVILVSLAVIFVPMILDDGPPLGSAVARLTEIPAPVPKATLAIVSPGVSTPVLPAPAPQKTVHTPDAPASALKPASRPEKGNHRGSAERAPAATKEARAAADKGWFVQVGTFSNVDNARQLAERLKEFGFTTRTENVQLAQGRAVRVRVGPFSEDGDAKTAQTRIEQTVGIKGVVLAYQ